jgi:hypothetical protein
MNPSFQLSNSVDYQYTHRTVIGVVLTKQCGMCVRLKTPKRATESTNIRNRLARLFSKAHSQTSHMGLQGTQIT